MQYWLIVLIGVFLGVIIMCVIRTIRKGVEESRERRVIGYVYAPKRETSSNTSLNKAIAKPEAEKSADGLATDEQSAPNQASDEQVAPKPTPTSTYIPPKNMEYYENLQEVYESDEELWESRRRTLSDGFYKALIWYMFLTRK